MVDVNSLEKYRDPEHFMEIVDIDMFDTLVEMYGKSELAGVSHALPLRVVRSSGVDVTKDFKVSVTDLNTDTGNMKYKQFTNNGDGGVSFKVDVVIQRDETWGYESIMRKSEWLEYWFTSMRPLYVISDALDVPNGVYLITKNQSRKQTGDNHSIWTLEFSSYTPLQLWEWTASQSVIKATTPAKTTTTKSSSSKSKALKDCTASNIVYSKTKKVTECNKLMQEKLYKLGFLRKDQIDGWYGPVTMEAVKKFQRWYNKKGHNLLVDGVCGPVTLKHLIAV